MLLTALISSVLLFVSQKTNRVQLTPDSEDIREHILLYQVLFCVFRTPITSEQSCFFDERSSSFCVRRLHQQLRKQELTGVKSMGKQQEVTSKSSSVNLPETADRAVRDGNISSRRGGRPAHPGRILAPRCSWRSGRLAAGCEDLSRRPWIGRNRRQSLLPNSSALMENRRTAVRDPEDQMMQDS